MKAIIIFVLLVGLNSNAFAESAKHEIVPEDISLCIPFMQNNFGEFMRTLEQEYHRKLEEAYDEIICENTDLIGIVIDNSVNRNLSEAYMRRYYVKTINKPELFTKILLRKHQGVNVFDRIETELKFVRKSKQLADGPLEKRLTFLREKYRDFVKSYPLQNE